VRLARQRLARFDEIVDAASPRPAGMSVRLIWSMQCGIHEVMSARALEPERARDRVEPRDDRL